MPAKQRLPQQKQQLLMSIAIVGAGFGGLSLAIALQKKKNDNNAASATETTTITIFESRENQTACNIVGDICLVNGKESMKLLGMSDVWDDLTKQSSRNAVNNCYVSEEGLLRAMREQATASDAFTIRYGHRILAVEKTTSSDGRLNCVVQKDKLNATSSISSSIVGPFDVVVGADGVLSPLRHCRPVGSNVAILGDARWVQDRWWDFGQQRIQFGAGVALRDGLDLAELLLMQKGSNNNNDFQLGRFCVKQKQTEIMARRWNATLLILVAVLARYQFPFEEGYKGEDLVAAVFVGALIHLGGTIQIPLPSSISPIPMTLHTLSATLGGLTLGHTRATLGAGFYTLMWTGYYYRYRKESVIFSWGYIIGMVSCAFVSGVLYNQDYTHPLLASIVGQCSTLLVGFLWLVVKCRGPMNLLGRVGIFLPGLLIKSLIAWRLLLLLPTTRLEEEMS